MARLDLSFSEVYNQVSDFLGHGTTPSGSNLTLCKNIVHRAYRQFLFPINLKNGRIHRWSFLKRAFHVKLTSGVWKYQLPSDFNEMLGNPQYGDDEPYGELIKVDKDYILSRRSTETTSSYPEVYAIIPVSTDSKLGTMWELWVWPEPNSNNSLTFTYSCIPEKLSADTDYFLGGPFAGEVILEMSLSIAESQEENSSGQHTQLANQLLTTMMLSDVQSCPDQLGKITSEPQNVARLGVKYYGTGTDWLYATDR